MQWQLDEGQRTDCRKCWPTFKYTKKNTFVRLRFITSNNLIYSIKKKTHPVNVSYKDPIPNGSPSQIASAKMSISLLIIYETQVRCANFKLKVSLCSVFLLEISVLVREITEKNDFSQKMLVNEMFLLSLFGYCHLNIEESQSLFKLHQSRSGLKETKNSQTKSSTSFT